MNSKIALCRIDDRLIHGQVMTAWLQYANTNSVLIVDDATAKDDYIKNIISLVVPKRVNVSVVSAMDSIEFIRNYEGEPLLILAKTPNIFQIMITGGTEIDSIIVGGMGSSINRKRIYKGVASSEEEIKSFIHLINSGVEMILQIVPDEKPVQLSSVLKEEQL